MTLRALKAVAIAATAMAGMTLTVGAASADTVMTLNHYMPENHAFVQRVLKPWGEKVAEVTEGRVTLEIPKAPLTPVQDQWNSVETGVADVAIVNDAFERQRLELMQVAYLPFMGAKSSLTSWALWDTYHKYFKDAGEYDGVKFLGIWAQPGVHVFTRGEPIESIDDLKGLKMVSNPGLGAQVTELLGASPVTSAGPASFEIISKGVADGMIFPATAAFLFKLNNYVDYQVHFPGGLHAGTWSVIMNLDTWNSISEEDQKAIDELTPDAIIGEAVKYWDEIDVKADEGNAEAGVEKIEASPELLAAVKERLAPIQDQWIERANAKGVDAEAALAHFLEQMQPTN